MACTWCDCLYKTSFFKACKHFMLTKGSGVSSPPFYLIWKNEREVWFSLLSLDFFQPVQPDQLRGGSTQSWLWTQIVEIGKGPWYSGPSLSIDLVDHPSRGVLLINHACWSDLWIDDLTLRWSKFPISRNDKMIMIMKLIMIREVVLLPLNACMTFIAAHSRWSERLAAEGSFSRCF